MVDDSRSDPATLVLASGSRYRKHLLARLGVPFEIQTPGIPETVHADEEPGETVIRLATEKARAVATARPGSIVIGADQIAVRGGDILGKPSDAVAAVQQLASSSGRAVEFMTGVCVIDARQPRTDAFLHVDITRVAFQPLTREQIERYVAAERPLDCAGSFKAEGLGIALFERIDSQDPTGLIGLPLIWLAGVLRQLGYRVP